MVDRRKVLGLLPRTRFPSWEITVAVNEGDVGIANPAREVAEPHRTCTVSFYLYLFSLLLDSGQRLPKQRNPAWTTNDISRRGNNYTNDISPYVPFLIFLGAPNLTN